MTLPVFTFIILALVIAANLILRWAWGRFLLSATPFVFALVLLFLLLAAPNPSLVYWACGALSLLAIIAVGFSPVRRLLARVLPLDPTHPLHTATLALALTLIFDHFIGYLLNGPAPVISAAGVTWSDQLFNFALMLGLAFFGIGALTRRSPTLLWNRLGFRRPNRFQIFFAIGLGSAFQLVSLAGVLLSHVFTPGLAQSVDQNSTTLLAGLLASPWGILFLALSAAFGEELLFRGALQPRLGLLLTAILFTSFHDQYGFSFDLLSIFLLALALGWLRNHINLWACIIAHFWFDFLASYLSYEGLNILVIITLGLVGAAICVLVVNSYSARLFVPAAATPIRFHQI
jgi:membrane protease YdiL (CAAX protease family)